MNQATKLYARFGLTEQMLAELLAHHAEVSNRKDKIRQNDGMPFTDSEAKIFAKIFATFAHDLDTCGLVATVMQAIKENYDKKQEDQAKAKKDKGVPWRADTIGMMQ